MVRPSGVARAMASVPTLPAAPLRFSTMNCSPVISAMRWHQMRERMSVPPPGGKMPMKRMGPFGQMPCAMAGAASIEAPAANAARRVNPSFPAIPILPGRAGLAPVIIAKVS